MRGGGQAYEGGEQTLRIIGGQFRSRVLASFKGEDIRPTADRVKESLFNILSPRLYGARVLDLFCGSGALGLESLSRGAREAVFNDVSEDSLAVLRKNIAMLDVQEKAKVYRLDYAQCLSAVRGPFDIIFVDPPYRSAYGMDAVARIARRGILSAEGVVVLERDMPCADETPAAPFVLADERKYGKTYLSFFSRREGAEER